MKKIGQITYEISEEEYNNLKYQAREVMDFFEHRNSRKDAEFAINRITQILEGNED